VSTRALVLDANILIRAALGPRVRQLVADGGTVISMFAPRCAYDDARRYVPDLLVGRGLDPGDALAVLDAIETAVVPQPPAAYEAWRAEALERIADRDADDWPILALSLALDCPIWTQDQDFFGTGVPTWTTDRVEIFFRHARSTRGMPSGA